MTHHEQVGEDAGPHAAGILERGRAPARGDPDRRRPLHGRREHRHLDRSTVAAANRHRLRRATAPARSRCPRSSTRGDARSSPAPSAKSLACQPDANDRPTRPSDRLSTTAHSSATRIGLCSGSTTLPARIWTCSVTTATAALVTAGFGIQAAELVEVTLGRPHRREAVRVGELRALDQQAVAVALLSAGVAGEVEEAERPSRFVARARRGRDVSGDSAIARRPERRP